MKTLKLIFHTDPGHGWLEVDRADLVALNIAHLISPYSYQKGRRAYLEEDCDAHAFMYAAKAAGWTLNMVDQYKENTPIRNFESFKP